MTSAPRRVVLVAAVAENGVIGNAGAIPWHLAEDMRHFRRVTDGHAVVMGRKTFESIGRALPGRTNVVVTRQPRWEHDGVAVAASVEEALERAAAEGDVMVIGGAQVYLAAMPYATEQVITEVHQRPNGDTTYPAWERSEWREVRRESGEACAFVWWERRLPTA